MSRYEDSIYSCTSPADLIGVVANIVRQQDGVDSFSSFSTSIYDTAWLSMVRKPSSTGQEAWLFPESFHFVLQSQQDNGTWPSYASPVDGILNTLACILALLVHKSIELDSQLQIDLSRRIQKAHQGLALLLESWNPDETIHVAFEILVPSLLSQVAQHGIDFEFAGRQKLLTLYKQKMELLKPEYVYSEQPTTLLHSLEVLVGLVDFDKVSTMHPLKVYKSLTDLRIGAPSLQQAVRCSRIPSCNLCLFDQLLTMGRESRALSARCSY